MDQKSDVIVVIGPEGVGKTSVVNSLLGKKVRKKGYPASLNLEKENTVVDGKLLEIWDIPSSYHIDQISTLNPNVILVVLDVTVLFSPKPKVNMLENCFSKENLGDNSQISFIINKYDCVQELSFSKKKIVKDFREKLEQENGYKNPSIILYSAHTQTAKKKNPIWEEILRKDSISTFLSDEQDNQERPLSVKKQKYAFWKQAKKVALKSSLSISSIDKQEEQKEKLLPP